MFLLVVTLYHWIELFLSTKIGKNLLYLLLKYFVRMFFSKFIYVIDHKTNGRAFFTNHNIAGFGLIAYNIYVRVFFFLALSPKMAPNSIKHPPNTSGTHPNIVISEVRLSIG